MTLFENRCKEMNSRGLKRLRKASETSVRAEWGGSPIKYPVRGIYYQHWKSSTVGLSRDQRYASLVIVSRGVALKNDNNNSNTIKEERKKSELDFYPVFSVTWRRYVTRFPSKKNSPRYISSGQRNSNLPLNKKFSVRPLRGISPTNYYANFIALILTHIDANRPRPRHRETPVKNTTDDEPYSELNSDPRLIKPA